MSRSTRSFAYGGATDRRRGAHHVILRKKRIGEVDVDHGCRWPSVFDLGSLWILLAIDIMISEVISARCLYFIFALLWISWTLNSVEFLKSSDNEANDTCLKCEMSVQRAWKMRETFAGADVLYQRCRYRNRSFWTIGTYKVSRVRWLHFSSQFIYPRRRIDTSNQHETFRDEKTYEKRRPSLKLKLFRMIWQSRDE